EIVIATSVERVWSGAAATRARRGRRMLPAGPTHPPGAGTISMRRGGRAVECGGLENRWPVTPARGFESLPLRHPRTPADALDPDLPFVALSIQPRLHRLTSRLPHAQPSHSAKGERSEEHTSELQSRENLVCRLLLEKKKKAGPRGERRATKPAPQALSRARYRVDRLPARLRCRPNPGPLPLRASTHVAVAALTQPHA